jgi:ribosomal protein L29
MAKNIKKPEIKLKDMSVAELNNRAREIRATISKNRLEKTTGKLKNTRMVFNLRKELARILTLNKVKSSNN